VDGGPHEVAVALLAGPGGEETLAASPSGLLCVVRLEGLLGEAVGGVGDTITPISADRLGFAVRSFLSGIWCSGRLDSNSGAWSALAFGPGRPEVRRSTHFQTGLSGEAVDVQSSTGRS
jgi:hypothetical protein